MFLKKSLEEKLKKSLNELSDIEDKPMKDIHRKKISFGTGTDKISFPKDHRCFNEDDVKEKARVAKNYVKNLIDPDILEIRQKPWHNSALTNKTEKSELKKILFEVRHGLKDFNVVKLKEKNIELGTDSRNAYYYGWNSSSLLEQLEKKEIITENLENSKKNSVKFWKQALSNNWKSNYDRLQDNPKVINKGYIHPFHKLENYYDPTHSVKERNLTLREIKNRTINQRTELRKIIDHENPKSSKEKLDSLVFQRMFNTIRDEFKKSNNIAHDNNNDNILKDIGEFDEKFVEGIVEKIKLQETMHQRGTNNIEISRERFSPEETRRREEQKSFDQKKIELALKEIQEGEKSRFKENSSLARVNFDPLVSGVLPMDYFKNNPEIEKRIIDEINTKKTSYLKNKSSPHRSPKSRTINYMKSETVFSASKWMKTEFHHPGVYTLFNERADKKTCNKAWSCCLNFDFESRGCHKKVINKMKWNLDPI